MPDLNESDSAVAISARRRISRRLLPYLFGLYVVAYLDRVNVGYAALEMTRALKFGPEVYGFGAGIFFVGYFILEIPGTLLVESWSARRWIARILLTWGVVAMATGFVNTPRQFFWVRFFLGLAEAGFFPGIVVYLSHWYRRKEAAMALAWFITAQPISNILGAPLSGWLLGVKWLGWEGWRWLFVVEGLPAVILGAVTLWYLTDWPHEAHWLTDAERRWVTAELERDSQMVGTQSPPRFWQAFYRREILVMVAGYVCIVTSIYGFTFWMPTVLQHMSHFSNSSVAAISMLPYLVGLVATVLVGRSSDRRGERKWHTAGCMAIIALGLAVSAHLENNVPLAIAAFCFAMIGMYGYLPVFWTLPRLYLGGVAAAASVGFINSVGNLGGFFGPYLFGYLVKTTHSFRAGMTVLAGIATLATVLIASLRPPDIAEGAHNRAGIPIETSKDWNADSPRL